MPSGGYACNRLRRSLRRTIPPVANPTAPARAHATQATGDELALAALRGDAARVRAALAAGADAAVGAPDAAGFAPLHRCALAGATDAVDALLAAGAPVDGRDAFGDTPLHLAAYCGHLMVVAALLRHGADAAAVSSDGRTPLAAALEEGHAAVVQALMDHVAAAGGGGAAYPGKGSVPARPAGADDDASAAGAAHYATLVAQLCDAAFAGDVRGVFAVVAAGADVNGVDADGFTPLHRAAAGAAGAGGVAGGASGALAVCDLLIGHGGDVNARDATGALCGAARVGAAWEWACQTHALHPTPPTADFLPSAQAARRCTSPPSSAPPTRRTSCSRVARTARAATATGALRWTSHASRATSPLRAC